jgi:uncharacterized protein HemX
MPTSPFGARENTGRFRVPENLRSFDFNEMEPTPVEAMPELSQSVFQVKQTAAPSKTFIAAVAAILGVLISAGIIIGVLGKAFYVQRDEYTLKNLRDVETVTNMQQSLTRMENTLVRQEAAFDRLADTVQTIKVDMAGLRRKN